VGDANVVETVDIAAPLALVWWAVSHPENYGRWSPENRSAIRVGGRSGPWQVGDEFIGSNHAWVSWSTRCRVAIAQPEQVFAFDVTHTSLPISRWQYSLSVPTPGVVRVTESWFDHRVGVVGLVTRRFGLPVGRGHDAAVRNRATMRDTLQAMKSDLEARAAA